MELIFNELSLSVPAPDQATARQWMATLCETMRTATDRGACRILRTTTEFWGQQLAVDYRIAQWSRDSSVDREMKRYVMSQAGKAPFIEKLQGIEEDQRGILSECLWDGQVAWGLGLADARGHSVVSIAEQAWCRDPVTVIRCQVTDTDIPETESEICNWYDRASVINREDWLRERLQLELRSGADLVKRQPEILKRLSFTPGAVKQIRNLGGTETVFKSVVLHLLALNFQAVNWREGLFQDGYPFPCSGESESTLQKFGDTRKFLCSDGQRRLFSLKSKINQEGWRIHFIPDSLARNVLVGYVGPHLPTSGDPT